jgi:hypothetical protein
MENATQLIKYYDKGFIKSISILTGDFIRRNGRGVYTLLSAELLKRKQNFVSFNNHSKILCMCNAKRNDYFTVEGSSNWTSNPRVEQYVITNNKEVFDFHKSWIDSLFSKET